MMTGSGRADRRTRVVATIGPASEAPETLSALVASGVDVFRLNASHAGRAQLGRTLERVREVSAAGGRHVAVLLDLGGPKLRVGEMASGTTLETGSRFRLEGAECLGDSVRACVNYGGLAADLAEGDRVLLDDGRIELRVTGVAEGVVETVVESGGALGSRKGLNVPGVTLGVEALTPKDVDDLSWGLDAGVDWVAQSFVRGPEDVERLRSAMGARQVPIVAKIEKHESASRYAELVAVADAVMVARGDLGVETSPEEVPVLQRAIVAEARAAGVPVVVATQMLESMTTAPRPTRAEASDVASAVFEGADALMLSAETAVGSFPVEAAETMSRIALTAEQAAPWVRQPAPDPARASVTQAVSLAAVRLAEELDLAAIVTPTQSGATARAVAALRPRVPILAVTHRVQVARRLALVWGVRAAVIDPAETVEELLRSAVEAAAAEGLARPGELVAVTAGLALGSPGATDSIQVRRVP